MAMFEGGGVNPRRRPILRPAVAGGHAIESRPEVASGCGVERLALPSTTAMENGRAASARRRRCVGTSGGGSGSGAVVGQVRRSGGGSGSALVWEAAGPAQEQWSVARESGSGSGV